MSDYPTRELIESGGADPDVDIAVFDRKRFMENVREYFQVSNARGAWSVIRQWIVIVAAVWFALWSAHWAGYLLSAIIISTRQHALGVIMHDQCHYRLFTNRKLSEFVSDLFCAFPIGLSTNLYRVQHLAHHRHTNTDEDPYWSQMMESEDWDWPKAQWECFKVLLYDLVGINLLKIGRILSQWSPWPLAFKIQDQQLSREERFRFLLFGAALLTFLYWTNGWFNYLVLWIMPTLTFMGVYFRMRGIAEHLVLPNEHELNKTRHVQGTWLERHSIAPLNVNYHIAHHLFPAVPQYNLPKVHEMLMGDPDFRKNACITPNYTSLRNGVLAEVIAGRVSDETFRARCVAHDRTPQDRISK